MISSALLSAPLLASVCSCGRACRPAAPLRIGRRPRLPAQRRSAGATKRPGCASDLSAPRRKASGPPATPLPLLNVPSVAARGIVRAAEESAVPADAGLQPAAAGRARHNQLAAVAAAERAVRPDRQSFAADRARRLPVLTVGSVRAAVEGGLVALVLAAYQMPPDTSQTRRVLIQQPPENGDIIAPADQFQHEGRRRATVRQKEDAASSPGQGYIEQTPLLRIGMLLGC